MKVAKSKANKALKAANWTPYATRKARDYVENKIACSMRKSGPVQKWIFKRGDAELYCKLVNGECLFEKTPATYWYCFMTMCSRIIFEKWLFKKVEGKSPNEDYSVQCENSASKLAEGAKRNVM
jgi:hypothetical protein